jgi:hypothetical protein
VAAGGDVEDGEVVAAAAAEEEDAEVPAGTGGMEAAATTAAEADTARAEASTAVEADTAPAVVSTAAEATEGAVEAVAITKGLAEASTAVEAADTGPAVASTAAAEEEGCTGTTEEATEGAVEAVAITKGLAEAEVEAAAEGAAPARAAARRTRPAVAAEATRGRRRRVLGEVVELAAARPSTPPSGGPLPRLRRGRLLLRPGTRRRRVRRDPLVSASPDLLARIVQLVTLLCFWCS